MSTNINIVTKQKEVDYFVEDINGVSLDMILIPSGSFTMGAEKEELYTNNDERPTHLVTISKPFLMGRYPITQAQWKSVTEFPPIRRNLDLELSYNEDSKNFPVKQVNWYDAIEFCARLTKLTNKNYRLPSEAEWEYACRAGTTTPFHFGETISTDLANYNGKSTKYGAYGRGERGERRGKTTANCRAAHKFT